MTFHNSHSPMLRPRELFQRPGPIPDIRLAGLTSERDVPIVARSPSSTTTSSSSDATVSCGPKDTTGPCERMVAASPNQTTLPIILGVVIPLAFAFILLLVLHRRHKRKLRQEDAEDKHKSLDFGLDGDHISEKKLRGKPGRKIPEMSAIDAQNTVRRDRGLSLDMSMSSPYILPPELQHSRESLHSLSRSLNTGDDKYRATNFIPDDGSLRSPSSLRQHDDASIYTSSSRHRAESDSVKGLLPSGHGQSREAVPTIRHPNPIAKGNGGSLLAPTAPDAARESYLSTASSNGQAAALRASNNYLGAYISGGQKESQKKSETKVTVAELVGDSPHEELEAPPAALLKDGPNEHSGVVTGAAGFDFEIPPNTYELSSGNEPNLPRVDITPADHHASEIYEAPGHESQRQSLSQPRQKDFEAPKENITPVPSNHRGNLSVTKVNSEYDNESDYYDDEEERQERQVRQASPEAEESYDLNDYKEVLGYDPRLLTMGMRPLPPDDPAENPEERALRIRSFYKEYFDETAKPGGEKARMSYFDGSENYIDDYYGSYDQPMYASRGPSAMSARGPPGRHRATVSNGSYMAGGPRAHSSASHRFHNQQIRQGPKKKLPPPQPLLVLPTPYKLTDDAMLPNPIDFAPPQVFKNQRSGTPDSMRGGLRPYSPSARAYNPLVSSFDDLSVLPSPHQLRKSSTFTSLDFAPPRFAAAATASDAGSIRSNRSGMSAKQLHNIRAGAYRISRIPKDVAGTKDELATALRPQWNAR